MILLIDNYDSFVYNIIHRIQVPRSDILVLRNDQINSKEVFENTRIRGVIISPGPMSPTEAGESNDIISLAATSNIPVLGICLGHQCIGHVFGCTVGRHAHPMHGKQSEIKIKQSPIFHGLNESISVGRYHSLEIKREQFNNEALEIIAECDDGTVMAIQHRFRPIFGLQFHPESILSGEPGKAILNNFKNIVSRH